MDAARQLVVERNLAPAAFRHLTVDAFMSLPFEALGPTKALLKRFFSTEPWTDSEAEALAKAVGPGEGWWSRPLDDDVTLDYGWQNGRFAVSLVSTASGPAPEADDPLAATFDGPVVPEATPNPRTVRFRTGPVHDGSSRWYESSASATDDEGVARLFAEFAEVANVLVGQDFVAVSLRRPHDWERLLRPVLDVVTEAYGGGADRAPGSSPPGGGPAGARASGPAAGGGERRPSRLEQAWADLGSLRPADAGDLPAVVAAAEGDDAYRRQVAANLLGEAGPAVAAEHWARLVVDPSRAVRRSTVDAMVDAGRPGLRPLLEQALADPDPWVRWKALRGLVELGPEPSRTVIAALGADRDFRVRLEVAAALKSTS